MDGFEGVVGTFENGHSPTAYPGGVWRPSSIEQFEQAVLDGVLEETHDFDAKRELPTNGKELAKDIAAMTTDGGVLVYGVAEDEDRRPRVLAPIGLAGAAERIDQIVQHSISGTPTVEFVHLRLPDDESRGYLLALIPPSPEAPHQVQVGDDRRFYGRSDTGNRRLSEEEIARLYERRRSQQTDRERLLAECVAQSPFGEPEPGRQGFLQAFAQPAVRDDELWDRTVESSGGEEVLLEKLRRAVGSVAEVRWGGSHLGFASGWELRGADKWSLDTARDREGQPVDPGRVSRADLSMDGRAYLFYGHAAAIDRTRSGAPERLIAFETGIALNLAEFLALVGALFAAGGLYGYVDVGMAVTGIHGAVSSHRVGQPLLGMSAPRSRQQRSSSAAQIPRSASGYAWAGCLGTSGCTSTRSMLRNFSAWQCGMASPRRLTGSSSSDEVRRASCRFGPSNAVLRAWMQRIWPISERAPRGSRRRRCTSPIRSVSRTSGSSSTRRSFRSRCFQIAE